MAVPVNKHRQFFLDARKRHGNTALSDQKRFGRKFIENSLQCLLVRHGLEVHSRFPWFADRQRPRRVTSDMTKQTDNVLWRNLEALSDLGKMCFWKQIGKPGQQLGSTHGPGAQRHGERHRKGRAARFPARVIVQPPFAFKSQMGDRQGLLVDACDLSAPNIGKKPRSSSGAAGTVWTVLRSPISMPTVRATIRAFSSWQLGLPDSSSTMKSFTRSGTGSKPGLRPAKRFAFLLDSIAEIACGPEHREPLSLILPYNYCFLQHCQINYYTGTYSNLNYIH